MRSFHQVFSNHPMPKIQGKMRVHLLRHSRLIFRVDFAPFKEATPSSELIVSKVKVSLRKGIDYPSGTVDKLSKLLRLIFGDRYCIYRTTEFR